MSEHHRAVFLSYASQDADAARRICEALRAAGVEVWFDQSELRGGDAWDAKIRKQIKECALFVPVISANTQARQEGYFRLEWRLADQRTHLMSHDRAFVLPVTIDATSDPEARVPESFLAVQWTSVRDEASAHKFAARVESLLQLGLGSASTSEVAPVAIARGSGGRGVRRRRWWPILAGVGALLAVTIVLTRWQPWRHITTPQDSEARKLVLQARALIDDDFMAVRENFRNAEELCQKAVALDKADGEAWATLARVSCELFDNSYDSSPQRMEAARVQAQRAMQLAPDSIEAALAMATYFAVTENHAEAERQLRALLQRAPQDRRVAGTLASVLANLGRGEEAREIRLHHPSFAGRDPRPLVADALELRREGRLVEAEAMVDRAQALASTPAGFRYKLVILGLEHDNLPAAVAYLETVPPRVLVEDAFASRAAQVYLRAGDDAKALQVLRRIPRDLIEERGQNLPKGFLTGWALSMGGKHAAAEAEWREALIAVERRLATEPNRSRWLYWKARLLAQLGRPEEAEKTHRLEIELSGIAANHYSNASFLVALGRTEEAFRALETLRQEQRQTTLLQTVHGLHRDPWYAAIRADPRVQKLTVDLLRGPAAAAPATESSPDKSAQSDKSVAVLPFLNRSGDAQQEYFSDGLTEEILGALRRERDLTVPGNTSCFSFKGRTVSGAEIAKALNVSRLVEGSVQRDGSRVRIRVTLSRPADNSSEELGTFTEELTDIFALQEKIARAVVAKLTRRKTTEPLAVLTKSSEAYDAYLRGRALQTSSSRTIYESIQSYERAVELDPAFALAWARLAEARLRTYSGGWDQSPTLAESVRVAVERALAAHPDLPEALIVRGNWARLVEQDFAKAQRDLDRVAALQGPTAELRSVQRLLALDQADRTGSLRFARDCVALDPGNGDLLNSVAQQFFRLGDFAAADPIYVRASTVGGNETSQRRGRIELRQAWRGPDAALRLIETQGDIRGGRGARTRVLMALGRMEEAGRLVDQDLADGKEPPSLLLHRLGRVEPARRLAEVSCNEARLELQRGNRASGIWHSLVMAELVLGHRDAALAALSDWRREQLRLKSEYRRVNGFHYFVIGLYTQLGRPDEDLALMREYIAAGWHRGYEWRHDWTLAPLRDDPRFQEIVRKEEALAKAQPDPTDA